MAQFGNQRDGRIKAAQKKLKTAKADVEKAKQAMKTAQQRLNEVLAEAEADASESSNLAEQIKAAQAAAAGTFSSFFCKIETLTFHLVPSRAPQGKPDRISSPPRGNLGCIYDL